VNVIRVLRHYEISYSQHFLTVATGKTRVVITSRKTAAVSQLLPPLLRSKGDIKALPPKANS
jgi:hypothetical protein